MVPESAALRIDTTAVSQWFCSWDWAFCIKWSVTVWIELYTKDYTSLRRPSCNSLINKGMWLLAEWLLACSM